METIPPVGPHHPLIGSGHSAKLGTMSARKKIKKSMARTDQAVPFDDEVRPAQKETLRRKVYEKELARLQLELVKAQSWIKHTGSRIVVIFEGRDGAGKGGTIKRVQERLNPRGCRVVALPTPTEREKTQWYFQRYVQHLPAAGEIVLFDRSWYNRAGVEKVLGFCTEEEHREFLRSCPEFERMLIRSGIRIVKYWFMVSFNEQRERFEDRINEREKRWKLSPIDLEARRRWHDYSRARDEMFAVTDIEEAPWYIVRSDEKRRARLNCISHLLSLGFYEDVPPKRVELPERDESNSYTGSSIGEQTFVPEIY